MKFAIVELKYVRGRTYIVPISWIKKYISKFKPTQSFICYISANIADEPNFDIDYFKTDFNGTTGTFKVFIIKVTNSIDEAIIYQREKRLRSVPEKFREPTNTEAEIMVEQNRKRRSENKIQNCNKRKAMVKNVAYLSDTLFKVENEQKQAIELPQKNVITNQTITSSLSDQIKTLETNDDSALLSEHKDRTVSKDLCVYTADSKKPSTMLLSDQTEDQTVINETISDANIQCTTRQLARKIYRTAETITTPKETICAFSTGTQMPSIPSTDFNETPSEHQAETIIEDVQMSTIPTIELKQRIEKQHYTNFHTKFYQRSYLNVCVYFIYRRVSKVSYISKVTLISKEIYCDVY